MRVLRPLPVKEGSGFCLIDFLPPRTPLGESAAVATQVLWHVHVARQGRRERGTRLSGHKEDGFLGEF